MRSSGAVASPVMGDFLRFLGQALLGLDHLQQQVEALSTRQKLVETELRELRIELLTQEEQKPRTRTLRAMPPPPPAPVARIDTRRDKLGPPGRKTPRGAR
jgi:hypothetical protein